MLTPLKRTSCSNTSFIHSLKKLYLTPLQGNYSKALPIPKIITINHYNKLGCQKLFPENRFLQSGFPTYMII